MLEIKKNIALNNTIVVNINLTAGLSETVAAYIFRTGRTKIKRCAGYLNFTEQRQQFN